MANCHACGQPLDHAIVECRFSGFTGASSLNGVTFTCHARCISLVIPDLGAPLPEQPSDRVHVEADGHGCFVADCRECGVFVAIKDTEDDAHLAAAHHLARKHIGAVA